MTRRAVMLLAGRGGRLGDLTKERPKCLLEIGGMSILERALYSLAQSGISEVIFVVGYRAEKVQSAIGHQFSGMGIEYLLNKNYAETNTAYSLWLAKDYLYEDCLLLEGDILFDAGIIERIHQCSQGESVWTAKRVSPGNDEGILISPNGSGRVASVQLVRDGDRKPSTITYKCAGIQLLTSITAQIFASELDQAIEQGGSQIFADLVLGSISSKWPIRLCSIEGLRWAEVDDMDDFHLAQALFQAVDTPSQVDSELVIGK